MEIDVDILPITGQSQIAGELPRKACASVTYTYKKQLEFILDLTANTYCNFSSMEICLPLKFIKKSNKALQMDAQMIMVNNFFGHWFTDIDIILTNIYSIYKKNIYRIPLSLICDLGLVNF